MAAPKIHGKMQKEVMKVLVRNLQEADIACMNDLFMFMDKGQTGVIQIEDI
jgi:hypothetical protein